AIRAQLVPARITGGPDAAGVTASGEGRVDRVLRLRRAEIDNLSIFQRLQDFTELCSQAAQLVALILGFRVALNLDVIGDDDVGAVVRKLAADADAEDGRLTVGQRRANVE